MVKSISDVKLFKKSGDKDKYLSLIKKCQEKMGFKLYAYCLMNNHAHLMIDVNGADISKIMHYINQCYAQYFNLKHGRLGHLFKDRFKSKIVDNKDYLFTLSAYIHKNPKSIGYYKTCPEKYRYCSLGVYLGIRKDYLGILDENFVMAFLGPNVKEAREKYLNLVMTCEDDILKKHFEFEDDKGEYISGRTILKRWYSPEEIINFVSSYTNTDKEKLRDKYNKNAIAYRALCIFLMRYYCDFTFKEICEIVGNVTLSRVSSLSSIGLKMINSDQRYKNIHQDFRSFKMS
jgi:REP element-mobilizing transposase RayT